MQVTYIYLMKRMGGGSWGWGRELLGRKRVEIDGLGMGGWVEPDGDTWDGRMGRGRWGCLGLEGWVEGYGVT